MLRTVLIATLGLTFALCHGAFAAGADWPTLRGPKLDGSTDDAWKVWTGQPTQAWNKQIGKGYSAVVVAAGKAYTMGNDGQQDTVFCFDAVTGKEVWKHSYACGLGAKYYGGGPGAAPAVDGQHVYTLSLDGHVFCLNAEKGSVVWKRHVNEVNAKRPTWGFNGAVLVQGDTVFLNVGDSGWALNKATGKDIWKSGGGTPGYADPTPFKIGNLSGIAIFARDSIIGVDPANGKKLFSYPWKTKHDVNASTPVFIGDKVFLTSDYGRGCTLVQIAGAQGKAVWENKAMASHCNGPVLLDGHLYGGDGNIQQPGRLVCIEAATGAVKWEKKGYNGQCILAGDKLLHLTNRGLLAVVEANPAGFKEIARAQVLGGRTCWSLPVLAQGRLYVRNGEGALVCLDLTK